MKHWFYGLSIDDPIFDFEGLVHDCNNSIGNALELLWSCTKPLIYAWRAVDHFISPV